LLTVMLYLSEGYEGGETVMHEDGAVIRARAGDALVFQHCQRHEGRKVHGGEKVAVRCDVFYTGEPVEETSNQGEPAAI